MDSYDELLKQLNQSEYELKKVNDTLNSLKEEIIYKVPNNISKILGENHDLELTHKLCQEDIPIYKEDIKRLTEQKKQNESEISKLKEENEKLKKNKSLPKKDSKAYQDVIKNLKDLSKKLGINFKKKESKDNFGEDIKKEEKQNLINKDVVKKTKEEFEKKFKDLKTKSNEFNIIMQQQNEAMNDYKDYLNEVIQYINIFNEKINISVINSVMVNNDNSKLNEINDQIDKVSVILIDLNEIIYNIKNNFTKNIENLLTEIKNNLDDLDKNENQYENNFNSIRDQTKLKINQIEKIFNDFDKNKNNFTSKNRNAKEEMKKLKNLHKELAKQFKNKKEMNKSIINSINNNQNQNIQNNNINQNNNDIRPKRNIDESFLFAIKDQRSKLDMYKTTNLFKENEQDLVEMYIDESELLRKNYHEICYMYDDYEIYDIYYELKAVGLGEYQVFRNCTHSFGYSNKIQMQKFLINEKPSKYKMLNYGVEFDINLKNLESLKIHMIYKSTKDLSKLSKGEKEERNIYRYQYYGISSAFAGQMAKLSLILKGSFDIVNFDDYFLIRNTNNLNEVEYIWGGKVPEEGKTTTLMLSKKEATWSFCFSTKFHSNKCFRNTKFYLPIEFIGGNNEIININPHSPQSSNLIMDEENRQYIVEYINTNYRKAEFLLKGELKNKCKGEWFIDLTEEQIEKKMPPEDVSCKQKLKSIAKKIIEDFDKNNKNKDFEFLDYMKIGLWVKNNIKYDYNYIGRTELTAMDIYNKRVGVCHHFTRLSNALLYSLGYKVIYASGYVCKDNKIFHTDTGHAWSLIQLDNKKWYPFDSTWGILSGKLPVGHIFGTFFGKTSKLFGYDSAQFDEQEMEGKFIK
jgi:hypothetical protein